MDSGQQGFGPEQPLGQQRLVVGMAGKVEDGDAAAVAVEGAQDVVEGGVLADLQLDLPGGLGGLERLAQEASLLRQARQPLEARVFAAGKGE